MFRKFKLPHNKYLAPNVFNSSMDTHIMDTPVIRKVKRLLLTVTEKVLSGH